MVVAKDFSKENLFLCAFAVVLESVFSSCSISESSDDEQDGGDHAHEHDGLMNYHQVCVLKRLYLVKTTSWQHRFFDLTILSPIWFGTYEYMKNTLKIFFFGLKQGFQSGFFRFGQKFSNLTMFLCT